MDAASHHLSINVSSTQTVAQCPVCGAYSDRIHSRYERTLADLPCSQFTLMWLVQVCKFFCSNPNCTRRIFCERISKVAAPWARKTVRLMEQLLALGLALGGSAGAHLGDQLGFSICGSTLLNHLRKLPLPQCEIPEVLGVDDFAFRRGHNYGTILVDLERHQPIALLPDRKAETLANWLKEHPGVKILSRDRSKTYRSAMNDGAPEAIQVADRFHLIQNLTETLEKSFSSFTTQLKELEQAQRESLATGQADVVVVVPKPTATEKAQQRTQQVHQQRVQQQKRVKTLSAQGWKQVAIAQEVGISERTVRRFLNLPDLPDTAPRRKCFGKGMLDPHTTQLLEWWNAGVRRSQDLMVLLQEQGFTGSLRTVQRYLKGLHEAQGLPSGQVKPDAPLPKAIDPQSPPLTPRRAAYLIVLKPEKREAEDEQLLQRLAQQHPSLSVIVQLGEAFLQMFRQCEVNALDPWLEKAMGSTLKPFQSFASGLLDDYAAVQASLTTDVSNGPVEGLNNRLKMLKRQMYGRAGLDLLAKRFIMAT
ncbi:MAG: ISL3 family transposase [Cyanobacteria bacterium P01_F01_bin.86]